MEDFYTFAMIISIATFTLTTSVTPGPNNIMVLSSGLTFGYKRSMPHMFGIILGYPFMIVLIGLGMGIVFEKFPIVLTILKYVGISYLLWMAYKIANNTSTYEAEDAKDSKPFTFIQGVLFQWVNPKAWIVGITAISVYITSNEDSLFQVLTIAFLYLLSAIVSTNTWVLGGVLLKKFIKDARGIKIFNMSLALLLVLSVIPVVVEQ